nr:hypothetical protein [Tanacetum cinerariifolium]
MKPSNVEEEQAANARYWKIPACCDDDDDYNSAITPVLSTKETENSLSMGDEHLDTIPAMESDECPPTDRSDFANEEFADELAHIISPPEYDCFYFRNLPDPEKQIEEEQAANARYWKIPACCDDDNDYNSAITPVLFTEEPDNSLSMGDEHLDTILATELDEVIKSSVEDLVSIPSESEGIPDTMCDLHLVNNPTPLEAKDHFEIVINSNDDISSSDDDSIYNENIEYVEASLYDYDLTNTFHNSLPEFENFCFDLEEISSGGTTTHYDISLPNYEAFYFDDDHIEEISSGSTTTHSDISLPNYEAFYFDDDHIEEISSGSTTTHSDISLSKYDSFTFDLSNDQLPIGVTLLMRSSPMNSLTSYLHRSMIVSTLGMCPIRLSSIPGNLKTLAKGFYQVFISSASIGNQGISKARGTRDTLVDYVLGTLCVLNHYL